MIFGVIKPVGPTSFDVVAKVRKITGVKKVGHAGTLDPLASGILIVAVGRESTKKIDSLMLGEKEYLAHVYLGAFSSTDDEEGKKTITPNPPIPSRKKIEQEIKSFIGEIEQTPPLFSAVKVAGRRAYDYVRHGKEVSLPPRKVVIKQIEILSYNWPVVVVRIVCGKGVYIRSLARDLGERLGTGGYIQALDRTRVGDFIQENSHRMDDLEKVLPTLIKKNMMI